MEKFNGKIPRHWEVKTLGEVCEIRSGKNQAKVEDPNGKYPIYGSSGVFGFANEYICEPGTTIIGRKGTINNPIYVSTKFWNVDTAFGLVPNPKIASKFLFYFCKGFNFQSLDRSTTIPSLSKKDLLAISLPIPPLPEQQAIVSKVEELFTDLDKGKQQLEIALQQLKSYRQSLLKWAFEGRLTNSDVKVGELPDGWRLVALDDVLERIEAGKSFRCIERPPRGDEVGVLKVSAVTWLKYNEQESKTVVNDEQINKRYFVKEGDFLFSRANTIDLVGSVVIVNTVEKRLMLSDKTLRFSFRSQVSNKFILYFLRSKGGRDEIEMLSTGNQMSMRNIGQNNIRKIRFPLPSIEEQDRIVDLLENGMGNCDQVESTILNSLSQSETLRQSILKQAFEGNLT